MNYRDRRLKILDQYLAREIILATVTVLFVLLLILMGNTMLRILSRIAGGELPVDVLWPLLIVSLLRQLVILLPLSLYLGVLLAVGRLYKDSEMAAMAACGIGTLRLYKPVLLVAIPVTFLSGWLALFVTPWTSAEKDRIKQDASQRSEISTVVPGRFNTFDSGEHTLFFERFTLGKRELKQVFLRTQGTDQQVVLETAESAIQTRRDGSAHRYMEFSNGRVYVGEAGQAEFRVIAFEKHGLLIQAEARPTVVNNRLNAKPTAELWLSSDVRAQAEFQTRLSIPVAALLLTLLALPLSHTSPRQGRFARLGVAILIYIAYSNMLSLGRALIEKGQLPVELGLWPMHVAFLLLITCIVASRDGWFVNIKRKASAAV